MVRGKWWVILFLIIDLYDVVNRYDKILFKGINKYNEYFNEMSVGVLYNWKCSVNYGLVKVDIVIRYVFKRWIKDSFFRGSFRIVLFKYIIFVL